MEAIAEIAGESGDEGIIRIRISGALDSARLFIPDGFEMVDSFDEADYYLANTYLRSDLYADGEVVYAIERGRIPIAVIKKLSTGSK